MGAATSVRRPLGEELVFECVKICDRLEVFYMQRIIRYGCINTLCYDIYQ